MFSYMDTPETYSHQCPRDTGFRLGDAPTEMNDRDECQESQKNLRCRHTLMMMMMMMMMILNSKHNLIYLGKGKKWLFFIRIYNLHFVKLIFSGFFSW